MVIKREMSLDSEVFEVLSGVGEGRGLGGEGFLRWAAVCGRKKMSCVCVCECFSVCFPATISVSSEGSYS